MRPPTALLFHLSGLGDTLFFLPALAEWRRRNPELRVTALTMFPAARDLLRRTSLVDEVVHGAFLTDPKAASLAFFLGLRRWRFDYGVVPYGSNRIEYNAANFLSGARRRLGHRYRLDPWGGLGFLNQVWPPQRPDRHAVLANGDLLAAAGLIGPEAPPALPPGWLDVSGEEREKAAAVLPDGLFLGVHAGSNAIKNQSRKVYPPALLAEALKRIVAERPGLRLAVLEGESDRERTDALCAALAPAPFVRVRPADIVACAALVDRCAAFVAGDSGLLHLAAARGKPCLALFGPTDPGYTHPWGVPHRVVALDLPCRPCFEYSRRPLRCKAGIDYACLRELPPGLVAGRFGELAREAGLE